jgi:hypothetical protein
MAFDFLAQVERLSATNLTIREAARLEQNPNDLRWRAIFPKRPVDSVRLSEFTDVDFRPAGGRREWNAQPREIPEVLGTKRDWEIIPINPKHTIDERRLQHLRERAALPQGGIVRELYDGGIIADVDTWATRLANSADVQIERDAFEAWFFNTITVRDTKSNDAVTVSMQIAADRYVAAGTTLSAATNAYRDFLGYARDARAKMGSIGGVRMRQAALTEILIDAPAANGDMATLQSLNQRMAAEGFGNFAFIVDERRYDDFGDGGSAYTNQYYVPENRMAFQPAGGVVGATAFAPVTRAWDFVDSARVSNVRDFTIFYSAENRGMTLVEEAQANALSLPTEQFVYVVTGI